MRGEFVDVGGCRLYYYASGVRGAGDPLVLVHGFATSGHLWSELVPLLPRGHRIVVLDLLGHGRSDRGGGFDFSARGHADRIVRLLDTLGIAHAAVLGHGLGGRVAQTMVLGWPSRVSRLCLVNSVALGEPAPLGVRSWRLFAPLFQYFPRKTLLRALGRRLMRGYADQAIAAHSIDQYLRPFFTADGLTPLVEQLRALGITRWSDAGSQSRAVTIPTAIVLGEGDPFLPRGSAARLQASIPSATLDYIPDARHFIPEEMPEQLARIVVSLMQR